MLRLERSALLRSTIVQVALLDRPPDGNRLRDKVRRGTAQVPRFRQVPVTTPIPGIPPNWVVSPEFDVDYHLRFSRLREPADLRGLLDEAARIGSQAFDPARPLWESHVIAGLPDGRAAAIQKIHHALGDGVSLLDIVMMFVDLERDPSTPAIELDDPVPDYSSVLARASTALGSDARALAHALAALPGGLTRAITDPRAAAESAIEIARSLVRLTSPGVAPLSPVMKGRSLGARYDTLVVPLDEMKAAGRRVDGKLNAAFMAGVAGGLDRYHRHHGAPVAHLRCAMPVNTRDSKDASLGNQFSPTRFRLGLDETDPIARLKRARDQTEAQRSERALTLAGPVARVLASLPSAVLVPAFQHTMRGIDVIVSNVPGSPIQLYVAGARSLANYGFSPRAGAALNITMISHMDELQLAINSDPAAISDPDTLVACLEESFDEIRKTA
jgi:WS/DGAT/MGAT family acyltransferase